MPRHCRTLVVAALLPLMAACATRVYDQSANSITTCTYENTGTPTDAFVRAESWCQRSGRHAVKTASGLCVWGYEDVWTCKAPGPQTRYIDPAWIEAIRRANAEEDQP